MLRQAGLKEAVASARAHILYWVIFGQRPGGPAAGRRPNREAVIDELLDMATRYFRATTDMLQDSRQAGEKRALIPRPNALKARRPKALEIRVCPLTRVRWNSTRRSRS